jgi:RND family efflux transporter MFP subunit
MSMIEKSRGTFLLLSLLLAAIVHTEIGSAETIVLDGLIEPSLEVKVGSSVPGILQSVDAERGDMVKKGQVVARMQSGVEEATLELSRYRAQTTATIELKRKRLEFAQRQKKRFGELYDKEALPLSQLDEVETNMAMAELELQEALEDKRLAVLEERRAQAVVDRMTIRSPVNGVVVERFLAKGEYVEDQPIVRIAQIDPLHVEVIATVELLGALRAGMKAEIRPEDPYNSRYAATVTIVDRVVDAASGTFGVRLELPNADYKLPAGLKCKVVFLED